MDFFYYALQTIIDHDAIHDPKFKTFLAEKNNKFHNNQKFYDQT